MAYHRHVVSSTRHDAVVHSNKTPPPFPRPLPTRPAPTIVSVGGISCFRLRALPPKEYMIFRIGVRAPLPTVTATPRSGSSACFGGDIRHVIIAVSLLCRHVATRGRGCRPPHVDVLQNTSTHGCNMPASTASPDAPIPPPLVRGHLLIDDQCPKRAHSS